MVAAVLFAALLQAPPPPPPAPPRDSPATPVGTAVIRGRVVAADTGSPIRDARVTLSLDERHRFVARSNEEGRFELTRLPAGMYRLVAAPNMSNPRYLPQSYGGTVGVFGPGKPIDLSDGQVLQGLELRLSRGGVLAGRVVDELGEPVALVHVEALLRQGPGEPRSVGGAFGNHTDDLGRFRLFALHPGEYVVLANPQGFVEADDKNAIRPLPTYFPSALTAHEATAIRLRPGQEAGEIEIRLTRGRTYKISGTILTSQGEPFSRRLGQAMLVETSPRGRSSRGINLSDSGVFEIRNLRPGPYTIEVHPVLRHPDDEPAPDAEFASVSIIVGDSDVEGVMVVTQPGAAVSGEVVFDEPPVEMPAGLEVAAEPPRGWGSGPQPRARVAPDGTFVLKGLFRPLLIRAGAVRGYTLSSVGFEGQDITDTPTEFRPGTAGKLVVTLSRRSAELSGVVSDGPRRPTTRGPVIVVAFAEDRALWLPAATTTRHVSTDSSGGYKLSGLRAGRYLVLAMPFTDNWAAPVGFNDNPELWEALAKRATAVTIGDNERKVLDLRLSTAASDR